MFVRFDLFSCSNMCLSVCNCFFQFSPASDTYMCMKVETETFAHPENQEQTKFYFSVDRVTSKEYLWINDGVLLWLAYTTTNKFIAIFRYFEMRRNIHWKNRPSASIVTKLAVLRSIKMSLFLKYAFLSKLKCMLLFFVCVWFSST